MEIDFKTPSMISKAVYAFQIINISESIAYDNSVSYSTLQDEHIIYIKTLISVFCNKCSKYFSKRLEEDKLLSRLTHNSFAVNELEKDDSKSDNGFISQWKYTPYRIIISGTQFTIEWCVDEIEQKCIIDIPDEDIIVNEQAVATVDNTVEHVSVEEGESADDLFEPLVQLSENDIPVSEPETSDADLLKRLKKARLRVKIAKFKAEQAYEKYVQRWGYLSEDSGSDSD